MHKKNYVVAALFLAFSLTILPVAGAAGNTGQPYESNLIATGTETDGGHSSNSYEKAEVSTEGDLTGRNTSETVHISTEGVPDNGQVAYVSNEGEETKNFRADPSVKEESAKPEAIKYEEPHTDAPNPYSLVCLARNSILYTQDKKTKLFTMKKDDSLVAVNFTGQSKWTRVLVSGGETKGVEYAYVRTEDLLKNDQAKYVIGTFDSSTFAGLNEAGKSYYVYAAPSIKSEKIAVFRKSVVLPVIQSEENANSDYVAVLTFAGVGYIRAERVSTETLDS